MHVYVIYFISSFVSEQEERFVDVIKAGQIFTDEDKQLYDHGIVLKLLIIDLDCLLYIMLKL